MMAEPPFERYPAPPRRDEASFRVISPWRDALAWVSIAGRLAISRYMVRAEEGWRDVLVEAPDVTESGDSMWVLERRDPVELVFRTVPDARIGAMAFVSVTRDACGVRIEDGNHAARVRELVVVPEGAKVTVDGGMTRIDVPAG